MKPKRLVALSVIVFAAVAATLGLEALGEVAGVEQFENFLLDQRQRITGESFQVGRGDRESEIVLVLFDEFSVMDPAEGWEWISPAPRAELAELVDALSAAGARTIGLDVYLDQLFPRLNEIDRGNELLRASMERAGNVVLVTPVVQTDSGPVSAPPHEYFTEVAAGVGSAELPASFSTFRDAAFAVRSDDRLAPSFALATYAHSRGLDADSLLEAALASGRIELPGLPADVGRIDPALFAEGATSRDVIVPFRIRFLGGPSGPAAEDPPGTFTAVTSFSTPLLAMLDPDLFRGKIVMIGTGFHPEDRFRTPFYDWAPPPDSTGEAPERFEWMYGVEIHAHALQNMIDGQYVHRLGTGGKLLLLILLAAITGVTAFRAGAAWGGAALVASILLVVIGAWWAWDGSVFVPGARLFTLGDRFLWVPVTVLMLASAFSYVGSVAYVSIVEGREKRFIKNAFGMYLSPDIVDEISDNPAALELGGQKRPLSLLFSDLSGFTTLSEHLDAQDLVALLNEYLDDMTQVVIEEDGYLDKYIGDAIMAFWNAPTDVPDHPDRAMRTAILMQRRMEALNERWAASTENHEPLKVRIGVHTGEVVVGNVGGRGSINYSAIGDAVNLAARLEPANKTYDTLNMVSEATLAAATGDYRVRELDLIAVVGKEEPVKVYELLEFGDVALSPEREVALERYAEGMTAYKGHEWESARERFEAALSACPDDGPSLLYVRRCESNIAQPPPPDWDFVVRRTKK